MNHPQTKPPDNPTPQPSENEVCEKAWELAQRDNPDIDTGQRNLFFYPATATPPPGGAGKYWRETVRGHWIKLAYAALTAPAEKEEEAEDLPPEMLRQVPRPSVAEVDRLAWDMARAQIPDIPSYHREYFLPRRPHPVWYETSNPWLRLIHHFFCRIAQQRLYFPHCSSGPAGGRQTVHPIPQKRHDRYYPVRTPTMEEVRRKAVEMASHDTPFLPREVRELFYHPEWVAPPGELKGLYWQGIVKDHYFVLARDALQREYNAQPRVRIPQRKWKYRRQPNVYRFWTRQPLQNSPPPYRRRVVRVTHLCAMPAAPPD